MTLADPALPSLACVSQAGWTENATSWDTEKMSRTTRAMSLFLLELDILQHWCSASQVKPRVHKPRPGQSNFEAPQLWCSMGHRQMRLHLPWADFLSPAGPAHCGSQASVYPWCLSMSNKSTWPKDKIQQEIEKIKSPISIFKFSCVVKSGSTKKMQSPHGVTGQHYQNFQSKINANLAQIVWRMKEIEETLLKLFYGASLSVMILNHVTGPLKLLPWKGEVSWGWWYVPVVWEVHLSPRVQG